jgi:predicted short-subunit dehydrogenase-like oxidoreductase (DUF2520 family)
MQVCYAAHVRLVSGTELEREGFAITVEDSARVGVYPPSSFFAETRLAVVGAGRLGTSLALAIRARGGRVVAFTSRSAHGRERAECHLGMAAAPTLRNLLESQPTLLFMTVPDGALPGVAVELAEELAGLRRQRETRPRPALIVHTSGATSVDILDPLAQLGCPTLALHPLQTFAEPITGSARLAGSTFAITPGPLCSYEQGARLAQELGGNPFLLREEDRPLYHAAAVFASNYLVTIAWMAEELAKSAGLSGETALRSLLPLMQGALDNLAERGSVTALTGPLSRGDESTIESHLQALGARHPEIRPVYEALGRATLPLVGRRRGLPAETLERLSTLLNQASGSSLDASSQGSADVEP